VFLVFAEGGNAITELHDHLYAGALHPHLRDDIPFVPHITIAAMSSMVACEQLARDLRERAQGICGVIDRLDLVDLGRSRVHSIEGFALAAQ